jgi:DNA-directed RNA polymerase specialized sigma24 family protein
VCRPLHRDGFAAAYAAHRPRLLAKAMAVAADRQHAEDAVQEAFLRAWSKCSTFDPDGRRSPRG